MSFHNVFFNDFGRIRSGWRFAIFLFSFLIVTTLLGAVAYAVLNKLPIGFDQQSLLFLTIGNLLSLTAAILLGWLWGKVFEGLPFRALGAAFTKNWFKHLILGLTAGTLAILLAGAIAYVFGGMSFAENAAAGSSAIFLTLGVSLFIFIVGAAAEEAIFRGYMLQTFIRSDLKLFGIILTSVLFASAHVSNPSADFLSWFNTFLAGILLCGCYLKTRSLWLPFGLHLTWNWIQGAFLGITVSGLKELITAPLLQRIDFGPIWLTGGDYGIEGGIACTVALTVTTLIIWFTPILKPTEEMLSLTNQEKLAIAEMKSNSNVRSG